MFRPGRVEIVRQGRQQHVISPLQPRHHRLADSELLRYFYLSQITSPANHGEVVCIDPIQLTSLGLDLGDAGSNVRTGQQVIKSLVPANERPAVGLPTSHERPL